MAKTEDSIRVLGRVIETLPNTTFKAEIIDENFPAKTEEDKIVLCRISGKMRLGHIKVLPGDIVDVEISLYDLKKGRIVYRHKSMPKNSIEPQPEIEKNGETEKPIAPEGTPEKKEKTTEEAV